MAILFIEHIIVHMRMQMLVNMLIKTSDKSIIYEMH